MKMILLKPLHSIKKEVRNKKIKKEENDV